MLFVSQKLFLFKIIRVSTYKNVFISEAEQKIANDQNGDDDISPATKLMKTESVSINIENKSKNVEDLDDEKR